MVSKSLNAVKIAALASGDNLIEESFDIPEGVATVLAF
jgi:hypothetical protein